MRPLNPQSAHIIPPLPDHWRDHFLPLIAGHDAGIHEQMSLRHVLLSLRDMPYARPRGGNTAKDCVSEWRGTCSSKHLAAHEWLTLTGYRPQLWMAAYLLDFQQPYFSDALRASAAGTQVYDVHNFLSCDLGQGDIIIDITFPARLGRHGFPVTADWDGKSDFTLCCTPQERMALNDLESADARKRAWLRSLNTDPALQIREAAIMEMTHWLAVSDGGQASGLPHTCSSIPRFHSG